MFNQHISIVIQQNTFSEASASCLKKVISMCVGTSRSRPEQQIYVYILLKYENEDLDKRRCYITIYKCCVKINRFKLKVWVLNNLSTDLIYMLKCQTFLQPTHVLNNLFISLKNNLKDYIQNIFITVNWGNCIC